MPRGDQIHLDFDHFVVDPGGPMGRFMTRPTLADLSDQRLTSLEGEAGSGKSTTVARFVADNGGLMVDAGSFASAADLREHVLSCAVSAACQVFIDSLDEVAWSDTAGPVLDQLGARGLRLRLVSRTAALAHRLDQWLDERGAQRLEIMPLTRAQIVAAAEQEGVDAQGFVEAVRERAIEPLAMMPLSLRQLLAAFREGPLPRGRHVLLRQAFDRLCTEHRPGGGRGTSRNERVVIAERIATYMMLTGRHAVTLLELAASPNELGLSDLAGDGEDLDGQPLRITQAQVMSALRTAGVFSAVAGGIGYTHRAYAEFATAAYLDRHQLTLLQLRSLLCHSDATHRVVPQLRGVASELASFHRAWRRTLQEFDPIVLVEADLALVDDNERSLLIDALLHAAGQGQLHHEWMARRRGLATLATVAQLPQLIEAIRSEERAADARVVAIDLGVRARLEGLADALVSVVDSSTSPLTVRRRAADGLRELHAVSHAGRLAHLLGGLEEDPEEEIRGNLLALLWPDVDGNPFDLLSRPRVPGYYGAYQDFLRRMPDQLQPEQLPRALRWVAGQADSNWPGRSDEQILESGWRAVDEDAVRDALVEAVRRRARVHKSVGSPKQLDPPTAGPWRRRVVEQAAAGGPLHSFTGTQPPLLRIEDLEWLLEQAANVEDTDVPRWLDAAMDVFLLNQPDTSAIEVLVDHMSRSSRVDRRFASVFAVTPVEGPEADRLRQQHRRAQPLPLDVQLETALTNDAGAWEVADELLGEHLHPSDAGQRADRLARLPATLQSRVLDAAEAFLHRDGVGVDGAPCDDATAACALFLLHARRPHSLGTWAAAMVRRSVPAVVEARQWFSAFRPLTEFVYAEYPAATLAALREHAQPPSGWVEGLRDLPWETPVEEMVGDVLRQLQPVEGGLLALALEQGHPWAIGHALAVARDLGRDDSSRANCGAVLLGHGPASFLADLRAWMASRPDLALRALGTASVQSDGLAALFGREFPAQDVANLYLWLRARVDPNSDPDSRLGDFIAVDERGRLGRLRDELLDTLSTLSSPAAVAELERIEQALPQDDLRRRVEITRARLLERTWQPIDPATLRALVASRHRRRVDSAHHLLEVVIEALVTVNDSLSGSPAMVQFLWNECPAGARHKDEDAFSDFLKHELDAQLRRTGTIIHREVEIRRRVASDEGQLPDLVVAVCPIDGGPTIELPIEVKGDWHAHVMTEIETKLAARYVDGVVHPCGLYVVGHFGERQRQPMERGLADSANRLSVGKVVRCVVLDCTRGNQPRLPIMLE